MRASSEFHRYGRNTETSVTIYIRRAGAPSHTQAQRRLLTRRLERMDARIIKIDQGIVWVKCSAENGLLELTLKLNFAEERLQANIMNELGTEDDGSAASAGAAVLVERFRLDYFTNGILEVWDADSGRLLGRCDPFIPLNVDMSRTIANFGTIIREIEKEANKRALEESQAPPSASG
jgi:hypothetical protein